MTRRPDIEEYQPRRLDLGDNRQAGTIYTVQQGENGLRCVIQVISTDTGEPEFTFVVESTLRDDEPLIEQSYAHVREFIRGNPQRWNILKAQADTFTLELTS